MSTCDACGEEYEGDGVAIWNKLFERPGWICSVCAAEPPYAKKEKL